MKLLRRKHGSQRALRPLSITIQPNWGGQGGFPDLSFQDENGMWYTISPESDEDCRELQSQAAIIRLNFGDKR